MNYLIFEQTFNEKLFNNPIGGDFRLPYSTRTYIDGCSAEFGRLTIEEKLCHLGGAIIRGIDLYTKFKEDIDNHIETYDRYDIGAKRCIESYICYLRNDYAFPLDVSLYFENAPLMDVVNLLEEEIMLRYEERHPIHSNEIKISFKDIPFEESKAKKYYEEKIKPNLKGKDAELDFEEYYLFTTEYAILQACKSKESLCKMSPSLINSMNQWKEIINVLDDKHLYFSDKELVFKGDEPYIDAYKKKQKDYKKKKVKAIGTDKERFEKIQEKIEEAKNRDLILQITPEPWSGNILNAKLILLSLNPGYAEYLNKTLANMFPQKYAQEISDDKRRILNMSGKKFDYSEATRILAQYYWRSILTQFGEEVYGVEYEDEEQTIKKENPIFSNVAICQWLAYASKADPKTTDIWPSQKFTKWVILYLITTQPDVIFLVMRSEDKWQKLLGYGIWNYLKDSNRLYISKYHRNQHLSRANIGSDQYDAITHHLKSISKKK